MGYGIPLMFFIQSGATSAVACADLVTKVISSKEKPILQGYVSRDSLRGFLRLDFIGF